MKNLVLIALVFCLSVTQCLSATYYVRADGTAVNKAAATGPASTVANCMPLTTFNGETFSAGDLILFSGLGGSYTTLSTNSSIPAAMHVVSSGSAASPIVYSGITNDIPLFDISGTNIGRAISANNVNYATVANMQVKGSGGAGAVTIVGTAGAADAGYTITVTNVHVLQNIPNDGFSLAESSGNTAQARFLNCTAANCGVSAGSHQGLTTHQQGKAIWTGGGMSNVNYFYVGVQTSQAYISNASFTNAVTLGIDVGDTSSVTFDNCNLQGLTGGRLVDATIIGTSVTLTNCVVNNAAGGDSLVAGTLQILDSDVTWNANSRLRPNGASSTIRMTGNNITITDANGYLVSAISTDAGVIDLQRNTITSDSTDGICNIGASTPSSTIGYNLFNDLDSSQIINVVASATGDHLIANNTFYQPTVKGTGVRVQGAVSGGTVAIQNNIFHSLNAAIGLEANATTISHNCYYNTASEGGTGSITSDPQFVSATDFHIRPSSPCVDAGTAVGLVFDRSGNFVLGTPDMGAYETYQWVSRVPNLLSATNVTSRGFQVGTSTGVLPGLTTTWTNQIDGVITQRLTMVGGVLVTNLTLP